MKNTKKLLLTFVFFLVPLCFVVAGGGSGADVAEITSGIVEGGLRVLPVDTNANSHAFEVFRGDYIVFVFSDNAEHRFSVPDLEIDTQLPKPEGEKPYVKMKKTGSFGLTIDDVPGTITVLQYDEPQYQEITSKEAAELIANIEPFILDVRTDQEYDQGHIAHSELLPVQELASRLGEIFEHKDEPVFVYCRSGNRSTVASKILIDNGFTNVINLRHGILEWQEEGLPIDR